jgi:hypothetical protein
MIGHPFIFQTLSGDILSSLNYSITSKWNFWTSRFFCRFIYQSNAPDEIIKYNCSNHNGMGANINVSDGSITLDVDSTIGFPDNGELSVTYNDQTKGVITYTSKNINQFFGCSNITGIINDSSNIGINTYAQNFDNLKNC